MSCSRLACKITAAYGRVKGGDKKPLLQPFQTLYTGKWIMYNNGPVTASSFSFQKRTAVPIKEAVAAFLLYFQSPLAVFLDFNSFPNILRSEFPLCSTHAYAFYVVKDKVSPKLLRQRTYRSLIPKSNLRNRILQDRIILLL